MRFIIGKKLGMTQVFRPDGIVVPVTRVEAGPCVVTQVKTKEKDGISAVQVGFGSQKTWRLKKPLQGHLKGLEVNGNAQETARFLLQFSNDSDLKRGDMFTVSMFKPGEKVKVTGCSKGKGFQGVVKRHGFAGGPASHGHKDNLRMPGSIGAGGVQRVFKGMRMGGHMGDAQITIANLEIIEVKPEANELWIKGAIPGARNGLVRIVSNEGVVEVLSIKEEVPAIENNIQDAATDTVVQESATVSTDDHADTAENSEEKEHTS